LGVEASAALEPAPVDVETTFTGVGTMGETVSIGTAAGTVALDATSVDPVTATTGSNDVEPASVDAAAPTMALDTASMKC